MKLKFNFNFSPIRATLAGVLAGTTFACAQAPASNAPARPAQDGGSAQRLVTLIDYVGGDYRGAVKDGRVLAEAEYEEQRRFASEIVSIGKVLLPDAVATDPLAASLGRIQVLVAAKAEADSVAAACRDAHDGAVARFRLVTRPLRRPSLEEGRALYAQACATCHGVGGAADTERAQALVPHPASFKTPDRLLDLSPYRVYNALTFGVSGTAMASFEALAPQERWDLAFYVFRLGHADDAAVGPVALRYDELAARSDRELLRTLAPLGTLAERRLAFARNDAPYLEPGPGVDVARTRELLRDAATLFEQGQAREADGRVLDAYLLGFEPAEPALRVRDSAGTQAVESAFAELRAALAQGDSARVRTRQGKLDAALARLLAPPRAPALPFVAAALIFVREGLEAALLVGALLAGASRLGRPEATRSVHAGWLLALPAGVLTWWLLSRLLGLAAHQRELMEAVVALVAAAVLFSVSFWLISKAESRRWTAYLTEDLNTGVGAPSLLALTGLAFLAVYREAAETILFTQALLLEAEGRAVEVWAGAATGLLAVAAIAVLMNRALLSRLPVGPFFAISSLLLLGLAVSFAGTGMYELVAAGYLRPRPVDFPEISWLGIHPDLTALAVQLTIVSIVGIAGLNTLRKVALVEVPERPPSAR